jgi:hypothetical protein
MSSYKKCFIDILYINSLQGYFGSEIYSFQGYFGSVIYIFHCYF